MKIKLLEPMMGREGETVALFLDGKKITRRVYHRNDCGLYVVIKNMKVFEYDFRESEEVDL